MHYNNNNNSANRFKEVSFSMKGSIIDNVDSWSRLGHNISN